VFKTYYGYGDKMKEITEIKYLFVDIGGVLLSDGWSNGSRKLASFGFEAVI
jgi:hypothetical protein